MIVTYASYLTDCLKGFGSRLTTYEQNEILDYPNIWFLGLDGKKIHAVQGATQNGGYDDENGSYVKVVQLVSTSEILTLTYTFDVDIICG